MIVTAKDLRFNVSMIFDVLSKGEEVLITYRGKAKAKLTPYEENDNVTQDTELFGMWQDKQELTVDDKVRNLRQGRTF